MSKAPSMPLFCDAYLADTMHLTLEEHGAYLKLLMVTWRNNGQPLPDDDARIARVLGITPGRWRQKLRPVLAGFFDLSDGTWKQHRLEKEWDFVAKFSAKQSEKGKKSAAVKALKNNDSASTAVPLRLQPEANPQSHIDLTKEASASLSADGADGNQPQNDADDPQPPPGQPGPDDKPDPTDADLVWGNGLRWLAKSTGKKPDRLRGLVGRWCKGGREAVVLALMRECREHSPPIADPVPWIETALANRSEANVRQAQQHRPAAHATRPSTSDILAGVLAAVDPQLQRH